MLFTEGSRYEGPWRLQRGSAILTETAPGGRKVLRPLVAGDVFAEEPLFGNQDHYSSDVLCTTSAELLLLPIEDAKDLIRSEPRFAWTAACLLAEKASELEDQICECTLMGVTQRVLIHLVRKIEKKVRGPFKIVRMGLCHRQLAANIGIRPETLSRALRKLEAAGKIRKLGRSSFQLFMDKIQPHECKI